VRDGEERRITSYKKKGRGKKRRKENSTHLKEKAVRERSFIHGGGRDMRVMKDGSRKETNFLRRKKERGKVWAEWGVWEGGSELKDLGTVSFQVQELEIRVVEVPRILRRKQCARD